LLFEGTILIPLSDVAMRRTVRQSIMRRSTESSVREEEEEEEDEDEEEGNGRLSLRSEAPLVAKLSDKDKLTIVSPSALAKSPAPPSYPKIQRGATVSTDIGRAKEIRPTLKGLHSPGAASTNAATPSEEDAPKPLTRVLSRGATEPLIKRIPTPAKLDSLLAQIEPPVAAPQISIPEDSSDSSSEKTSSSPEKASRKHSNFKPSKLLQAPGEYDSHMERFGESLSFPLLVL
jgi:hypothetical protein